MIHIKDKEEVREKIARLHKEKIHIIADFDATLTKRFYHGKKVGSSYALIRNNGYLGEEYTKQEFELFNRYYPIEIDPEISSEVKYKTMEEWWKKHFDLMVEAKMGKWIFEDIIKKDRIHMREGYKRFRELIKEKKIPLLVFSAGLGNIITEFMGENSGVHVISNFLTFDKEGKANGYSQPPIHTFNKNEYALKNTPYYEEAKERSQVILLGDNLADAGMSEGLKHDVVLKIGFLNEKIEERLEQYSVVFDIIITDDGPLDYVNELLEKL